jgi:putative FmdB family regulatory protein
VTRVGRVALIRSQSAAMPTAVNLTSPGPRNSVDYAMPIYEFRCTRCRRHFSHSMPISEHGRKRPACPKCGSRSVQSVLSTFFAKTIRKS